MNITIDTEKLWDFVRDAYEEGMEDGKRDALGLPPPHPLRLPRSWSGSDAKEQVRAFIANCPVDWAQAREELED